MSIASRTRARAPTAAAIEAAKAREIAETKQAEAARQAELPKSKPARDQSTAAAQRAYFKRLITLKPGDDPGEQPLGDLFAPVSRNPTPDKYRGGILNSVQQCDLIELPLDESREARRIVARYKGGSFAGIAKMYALVVVDVATRTCAARAITNKGAVSTRNALRDVYLNEGPIGPLEYELEAPLRMEFDGGSEFKGEFARLLRTAGTFLKTGRPKRSRQQGMAENLNRFIGRIIGVAQTKLVLDSIAAGAPEESRDWVSWLDDIMGAINERLQRKPRDLAATVGGAERLRPLCRGDRKPGSRAKQGSTNDCLLLSVGDRVRVKADRPENALGKVQIGSRRAGDMTFNPEIRTIEKVLLTIGGPPRYIVNRLPQTSFTRNELRPV